MSADLDQDLEVALREFVAQPPPIERQLAKLPVNPPPIDRQPTLPNLPPSLAPEAISERLKTVVAPAGHDVAVAIEGGIAAVQQASELQRRIAELEVRVRGLVRAILALKGHLLLLEPAAVKAPRIKALITTSLRICAQALASVGEG